MFVSLNFKSFATLSVSLSHFEVNVKNLLISSHCRYARKPCTADWVCLLLCFQDCKNPPCLSCLGLQITLKALILLAGTFRLIFHSVIDLWGFLCRRMWSYNITVLLLNCCLICRASSGSVTIINSTHIFLYNKWHVSFK